MKIETYANFKLRQDDRGVVTAVLNVPDRPMNVLSREVMEELQAIVKDLRQASDVKIVVFRSSKESGFLAGADISGFTQVESPAQASEMIKAGQDLFTSIEQLPITTIAAIHGPCLGGGLELSLCCNYRLAQDNGSTKIGLPEIMLGLIPGWGGTQRLPKQVGLAGGMKMILTGKHLSAAEAYECGLVDRVIDRQQWDQGIDAFVNDVLQGAKFPSPRKRRPLGQRLLEATGVGRSFIFKLTEKQIRSKVDQYPALGAAVKAVKAGYSHGAEGFTTEREEFVKLIETPTCHSLLGLFFAREKARSLKTWSPDYVAAVEDAPLRTIGVIGAGAMGAGIATTLRQSWLQRRG